MDAYQVADQFGGHPASGLPDDVTWANSVEQRLGLNGGEVLLRSTWNQLEEQLVELGDHPGVVLTE